MRNIGVTGHQNIPPSALTYICAQVVRSLLLHHDTIMCISSLATGADQLVADICLKNNGALHVIVPCKGYLSTFKDTVSAIKYKELCSQALVIESLEFDSPSEEAFLEAGKRVVLLSDLVIAIWDGKKAKGKGGTADIVRYAELNEKPVEVIWPQGVSR
jgi:hypothetical protein